MDVTEWKDSWHWTSDQPEKDKKVGICHRQKNISTRAIRVYVTYNVQAKNVLGNIQWYTYMLQSYHNISWTQCCDMV